MDGFMRRVSDRSQAAQRARLLLQDAHAACFKANTAVLGMSNGPFSGVNEVLGIIAEMDDEIQLQRERIKQLESGKAI
jgi:hypothetical protein